jgi:hypothetical protein
MNSYYETHTVCLACRPNAKSLIRNPFRTKQNALEQKQKQMNTKLSSQRNLSSSFVRISYMILLLFNDLN